MSLYLDDDDELRAMRERFMQSGPDAAAGGNPYGAPSRELDPRMLQGFLAQKAPDDSRQAAYPIPQREQGLGVADWFPLAAAGLDLAFNKGRGMGGIAQSAAGMSQRRDALSQQQFEDDRNAYLKQGEAGARDRQIDLAGRNADMRQMEIDAQLAKEKAIQARWLGERPDPELERRAKEAEIKLSQARAMQAEADAKRDPNAVDAYKQQLIEESKARTDSLRNPQAKADSPELAYRKGRDAKEDADKIAKKQTEVAALAEQRQPPEGVRIINQGNWDAAMSDKVQGRRIRDGVAAYQSAWRALERMKEIRAEHGTEFTKSAASGEYKTLSNEILASIGTAANAGVLQPSDITRFQEQVPDLGPQLNDMLRLIPGHGDPTIESMKGTGAALRDSARVKASAYGFEYDPDSPIWLTQNQLRARAQQQPPAAPVLERQPTAAPLVPEEVPPPPRGAPMPLPRDMTAPGPETQEPTQRLGASGPTYRGTQGFPGSGAPSNTYQGPTAKPIDIEELRRRTRTPGVVYRP